MKKYSLLLILPLAMMACSQKQAAQEEDSETVVSVTQVTVEAEDFIESSRALDNPDGANSVALEAEDWLSFDVTFATAGRYNVEVVNSKTDTASVLWLEDYIDNPDNRTYDVTGKLRFSESASVQGQSVDGSPFNSVARKMKLHVAEGKAQVDKIVFTLMKEHQLTPITLTQNMEGDEWELVWSDEFDGTSLDTTKWLYDVGDWGWGNNELQYYTENRTENARVEDGNLIIEARKNDMGVPWTSARLTTRGKVSFLYGKIEFKALVPKEKGNWAAGWTLGDGYVDELSWPYVGEIDVLESVGYEVDNETGDGIAHCTVHTPAYYFKINNQISSVRDVKNIAGEFHTYSVEWTPSEVRGFVDGEEYYLYDKTADAKEWPFDQPQNLIINLAMGGGWGGAQGMDTTVTSQKFVLDHVRVYALK